MMPAIHESGKPSLIIKSIAKGSNNDDITKRDSIFQTEADNDGEDI